ncbi:amidase [Biostraticola tofi]|uniref:Amidase/aspartyl-tRNA(Asn)/glutamyl-tRNA(Gln) amidotransferase subunit A n=1 Tax=Biostraticola tofi TaxID=466109 RepID=A0A4R3YW35_9GAMM|nr:amidase [Biostraticola tofi]TCV96712.1 amidase/aspartyl-tRNA(Asn)/glutamyl-tRNA(Gln) amidotransferase subunit A [Biostraticola tofi]
MTLISDTSPFASIAATRRQLQQGLVSPSELLDHFFDRIAKRDPQVKAWVWLNGDQARSRARELDQEMGAIACKSALFGIPYGAKDIFHTRGIPTEAGSRVLEGFIPEDDASVIERLEMLGAQLLGKTSTTEFANLGTPPATSNAWNSQHTPGGSSSGSAAAMGARMALMTLGTQTAGSLSRPGAFNGVTVLKASYGRISKAGVIPVSWTLDHVGAFTQSVEDAVLVYNCLAGPDKRDPATQKLPFSPLALQEYSHLRVGIVDHPYFHNADDSILSACSQAMQLLARTGVSLHSVGMPESFIAANDAHLKVMQAECASYHHHSFRQNPERFGQYLQGFLREGLTLSAHDYLQAQQNRMRYQDQLDHMFEQVDILMTPASQTLAPHGLAATGSPAFNMPFTNAGVPTLQVPVGLSPSGLPIGIQWVARTGNEQALVDLGMRFQQLTDWHTLLPPICRD